MTRISLDQIPDDQIERLYNAGCLSDADLEQLIHTRISPRDLAIIDAFAYGLAKLFHTPINQLVSEADTQRRGLAGPIVGSKAGTWANQALDYALNTESSYVATAYMKPPPDRIYDQRSRWVVYAMPSRRDLDAWYQSVVAAPSIYHYVAAFDKTSSQWGVGRAVAATAEASAYTSGVFRERSKEHDMSAYGDYVGADGQSYPEVASRAVTSVHHQTPSPVYGYLRTGAQQKIYLYPTIADAHGWFAALTTSQAQPYDYAAVFAATDLTRPVPGLESFGHALVSGDPQVGSVLPFLLGLPAGAVAGYFLRRWQEENPGHAFPGVPPGKLPAPHIPSPKTSGEWIGGPWIDIEDEQPAYTIGGPWLDVEEPGPMIGGPWVDIVGRGGGKGGARRGRHRRRPMMQNGGGDCQDPNEDPYADPNGDYTIGGPWLDVVGAEANDRDRRRSWSQTRALIQSAINEVTRSAREAPAEAYVWSLEPPSASPFSLDPSRLVTLEGTTGIIPFASTAQALDYMRDRIQTPHVALALFDRRSTHWPNPTNWTKSNDPAYESVIATQAAKAAPSRYVGAIPWHTTIGAAIDDVRTRAQTLANKRAGNVVGVIHTSKDGLWHALAFRNADDADDWLGTATQDPAAYTYAAYYDKQDFQWPHPVNEKIGGSRGSRAPATTSGWRAA